MPRKPKPPTEFVSTDDIIDDDDFVHGTPDDDGNVFLRRTAKEGRKRGEKKPPKKPAG